MSAVAAPFGLRTAFSPSGIVRTVRGTINSGYATNIAAGSPIAIDANGFVTACAAGSRAMGIFQGVEYTDAGGRRQFSHTWTASVTGTDIFAYHTQDPDLTYEIQANATLTVAAIGQQYDWSALAQNGLGFSTVSLNVASAAANAGLQVVGLRPGADNDWGDNFPIVLVRISEHQIRADVAGF